MFWYGYISYQKCFSCLELSVSSLFILSLLIDESTDLKKVPKAQKSTFIVATK